MTILGNETLSLFEPFWLEQGGKIRKVREIVRTPQTPAGNELCQEFQDDNVFKTYNRFRDIYGLLIAFFEHEEIGKELGVNYFTSPTSQRIVLRAFALGIEDIIESPYFPGEIAHECYQNFLNLMREKLRNFDRQIVDGNYPLHFLNSLAMHFNHALREDQKTKDYKADGKKIRERIRQSIEILPEVNQGAVMLTIGSQLEFLR